MYQQLLGTLGPVHGDTGAHPVTTLVGTGIPAGHTKRPLGTLRHPLEMPGPLSGHLVPDEDTGSAHGDAGTYLVNTLSPGPLRHALERLELLPP